MRDRPAAQAGLQVDDILIAVDGAPIDPQMTTDEIVLMIRGPVGEEVTLTVERAGQNEPVDVTIVRAIIETPSAHWQILEDTPTIGYIQLTAFTERTNNELEQAIDDLTGQGAEKFVVDLRNNGGGLLDAAIDVAIQFVREGEIVREDRKNEGERSYNARGGGQLLDQPVVLLVNGGTASASEIVAGALQDYNRATLIGEKTFGKGSVQLIYELSDASRLHVTVAKWFTPNGSAIDGIGLTPDIEVLVTEDDRASGRDPQLERAVEVLQSEQSVVGIGD